MTSNTSRTRGRDRVLEDVVRSSAVDRQQRQTRRRLVGTPLGVIAVLAIVAFAFFRQVSAISVPEDFANDEDHFKYRVDRQRHARGEWRPVLDVARDAARLLEQAATGRACRDRRHPGARDGSADRLLEAPDRVLRQRRPELRLVPHRVGADVGGRPAARLPGRRLPPARSVGVLQLPVRVCGLAELHRRSRDGGDREHDDALSGGEARLPVRDQADTREARGAGGGASVDQTAAALGTRARGHVQPIPRAGVPRAGSGNEHRHRGFHDSVEPGLPRRALRRTGTATTPRSRSAT